MAGDNNTIVIAGTSAECALGTQMSGASAFGISYLLAYSIETDPFSQDIETQVPFEVTTIVVTPSTGAKLLEAFQKDSKYQLKFNSPISTSAPKLVTGGLMSNFSSFGPAWDSLAIKPQLSAPGGKILSTYVSISRYQVRVVKLTCNSDGHLDLLVVTPSYRGLQCQLHMLPVAMLL